METGELGCNWQVRERALRALRRHGEVHRLAVAATLPRWPPNAARGLRQAWGTNGTPLTKAPAKAVRASRSPVSPYASRPSQTFEITVRNYVNIRRRCR